jgi:hypothetical protein
MSKNVNQNNNEIDTSIFDETLKKIEELQQNLNKDTLEENHRFQRKEDSEIKKEIIHENIEHKIDNSLLAMEELHNFNEDIVRNKKEFIGFYRNLILIIFVFVALYALLNFSKEIIISKYPSLEPSIVYFFEIIEILKFITINIMGFIKNLITIN